MGINYNIEQFKVNLINLINNCELPVGVAYFVLKDVYAALEREYAKVVKQEATQDQENIQLIFDTEEYCNKDQKE